MAEVRSGMTTAGVPLDAFLTGWKAIAQSIGVSEPVARRLAKREGMPVFRALAVPDGDKAMKGGRVWTVGLALHVWGFLRALGLSKEQWMHARIAGVTAMTALAASGGMHATEASAQAADRTGLRSRGHASRL